MAALGGSAPLPPSRPPRGAAGARARTWLGGSAPLLVIAVAVSMHLGSAIATGLFGSVGPLGALWLRTVFAALLLAALARGSLRLPRDRLGGIALLGLSLAAMNACFFAAISHIPLGVASTIEFVGPLAVAAAASRGARDLAWVGLAGAGVALLGSPGADVGAAGALFALGSAACWAAYIVIAKRVVADTDPLPALAATMVVAALVLTPPALASSTSGLGEPDVLARGLAVAVLASAVPYLLELLALRLVSAGTFGILLSLEPAVAALIGFAVLSQSLHPVEIAAMACVVAASAGASRARPA